MTRHKLWAGLDVGVETTSLCIIDHYGEILRECSCPTITKDVRHELATFRRNRFASVILESGCGIHIARGLRSLGYPVELFEARTLSKFLRARRNKTDAGDAKGIAEAGRIGASMVSRVYMKDLEAQRLQALLTIRRHLISQRVAVSNLLGRTFEQFGGRLHPTQAKGGLAREVQIQSRRLFTSDSRELAAELRYLADISERLREHQREIDCRLKREAMSNDTCCQFMEIPGVGPICALNFYAAVGDPHRFSRSADIGAYLGLTPTLHQSGLTFRMGRISKMGNEAARSSLVQAAVKFVQHATADSDLRIWTLEVENRRGKFRSRVALARKLAVVMLTTWKNGTHYNPQMSRVRGPAARELITSQ